MNSCHCLMPRDVFNNVCGKCLLPLDAEASALNPSRSYVDAEYVESLEQQNRDLVEALKAACHYLVFHSQGKGATEFFQMNEDAAKGYAVLAKHGVG